MNYCWIKWISYLQGTVDFYPLKICIVTFSHLTCGVISLLFLYFKLYLLEDFSVIGIKQSYVIMWCVNMFHKLPDEDDGPKHFTCVGDAPEAQSYSMFDGDSLITCSLSISMDK